LSKGAHVDSQTSRNKEEFQFHKFSLSIHGARVSL
jgi:hypothetical protein